MNSVPSPKNSPSSSSTLDQTVAVDAVPADPSATPRPLVIPKPSMADVPSIFSPRYDSSVSSSPSFSPYQMNGNSLSLQFDSASNSPSSSTNATSFTSDGLPLAIPNRPTFQTRKSSISALPRRTPQPMPLANLPTLPPMTPSDSQPEDPMRTIRSMPRVLMTPKLSSTTPGAGRRGSAAPGGGYFPPMTGNDGEDEEGGDAGDGSESEESDEEELTADQSSEDEHVDEQPSSSVGVPTARRASVSSISVDSINEESDDEEAQRMGSLPLDGVTLSGACQTLSLFYLLKGATSLTTEFSLFILRPSGRTQPHVDPFAPSSSAGASKRRPTASPASLLDSIVSAEQPGSLRRARVVASYALVGAQGGTTGHLGNLLVSDARSNSQRVAQGEDACCLGEGTDASGL